MLHFDTFTLANGLRVHVIPQPDSQLAHVNLMYDVGARDEDPQQTGFAHLFEHLMFGGSKNIPDYDTPLQRVGGTNNAYTTNDVTNYYCSLPAANLETAFWLESDRMLSLGFAPKVLEVQRKVVMEEFKENYLNTPYGDAWLHLCDLAYTTHPYRWPTIGKELSHIADAKMPAVKAFFKRFYVPNNAVLVVKGGVTTAQVQQLAEKWFGPLPAGDVAPRQLPQEPPQTASREKTLTADVPLTAIYQAYPMAAYGTEEYYATTLLAAALGGGRASRLYAELVKEKRYFHQLSVEVSGTFDPGLLLIQGKLAPGIAPEKAMAALQEVIVAVQNEGLTDQEVEKVKNQAEAAWVFASMDPLHDAEELATASLLGDPQRVNRVMDQWRSVTTTQAHRMAQTVLAPQQANTLYYLPQSA